MSVNMLTDKARKEVEKMWLLRKEALEILDGVVMEWRTDPQSVQCFDLRIVARATEVMKQLNELKLKHGGYL